MTWDEALRELASGTAVWREKWDPTANSTEYLDSRFTTDRFDTANFPFVADNGVDRFRIVRCYEGEDDYQERPYTPDAQDKTATDWCV